MKSNETGSSVSLLPEQAVQLIDTAETTEVVSAEVSAASLVEAAVLHRSYSQSPVRRDYDNEPYYIRGLVSRTQFYRALGSHRTK